MKCSACEKEGKRSIVQQGGTFSTLMGVHQYYDEDGKYHCHDPNTHTTSFRCSNGHDFGESRNNECWCGWGKA